MQMLGLTQEEYHYYRQEVYRKGYEERDKAYRNIPDVQNGIVTAIVVSLVVGALFTVAAAALAPKPKQPKPPSVDQRKAGGTKNLGSVNGSTRFNQSFGFQSVSEVAQYGETVPLVFGKYKGGRDYKRVNLGGSETFSIEDDGFGPNFSGGNLIAPKLVWSRVLSYGHSQVLFSLYVVASQGLPRPEVESVWLGQSPLDTLYEKDFNLFWRGDDGGQQGSWRITARDMFAGSRGTEGSLDPRNTQDIYTAPTNKSLDTEDAFCMAYSPAGQTQFGVYSPIPNTYMRLNYASISRPEDAEDEVRDRAKWERQKIWGYGNPHYNVGKGLTRWMGLCVKTGEGSVPNARGLKYCNKGDRFEYVIQPNFFQNTHGDVNYVDVSNSTKEMREAADDKLQLGDEIQIGTGKFRVVQRAIPIFEMSSAEAGEPGIFKGYEEDCNRRNDRYANNTAPGCRVISGVAVWNPGNDQNDYRVNYYFADQMVEGKNGDFKNYDLGDDGDLARYRGTATVTYPPGSNTQVKIKFKCGKPVKKMTEGSSDTGWSDWDDEDEFGRAAYYEIKVETASGQPWSSDKGEGGTQVVYLECEEPPIDNHIGLMSLNFLNIESPNYGGNSGTDRYDYARYPQGEALGIWNNVEEWWFPLLRYNQAVIRNSRPTACTEIGIRSNVWNQMTGLCNFNTIPTVNEMERYDRKNVNVNNGTYSTYFTRYSFFIVQVRPSGRSNNAWTTIRLLFAVRGQRPVDQFNFIRFQLTGFYEGQLEFKLDPVPGSEVARFNLGGPTGANTLPAWFEQCWLLGPPAQTSQLSFSTNIQFIAPGDVPIENGLKVSTNARVLKTSECLQAEMMVGKPQSERLYYEYSTGVSEQTYYEGYIARSSDSGPEHEVMYVNESVDFERPKYNNLTTMGLNIRATGKFSSMDQPRIWIDNGRKIPIIKDSVGSGNSIQWRADYTNNYVDVVCWLLTNETFGYGDVVSKELVDWDGMRVAAKFVDYKNFTFDGSLDSKVNLREWIGSTAPLYMLNFTIANGMFSLRPAVPTFPSGVESPVQYAAIFTDTNILDDTMKISWIDEEDRAPFRALMRYRVSEKNQLTVEKTVLVYYSDSPPTTPIEEFDLTDYITTREHAISVARYYLALRRRITHKIEFETTPEMMANVSPGDFILVYSRVNPNQPSRTGVIEADGTVRMMGSDLTPGIYDGYWWNPGEDEIRQGPIVVNGYSRVSAGANPICCGAIFSVTSQSNSTCEYYNASEATAVTYQVDQIEINDEGIITVNGSVYPVTPPDLNCNPLFDVRSLGASGLVSDFEKNNRYAVVRSDISDANNGAGTGIPNGSYSVIGADASGLIETGKGEYYVTSDPFPPEFDAPYGYQSNYDEYQRLMEGLGFYDSFLIYTPPTIYGCGQTKNGARLVPVGYYNSAEIIYYRQAVTGLKEQNVLMYKFFYNGVDPQQYDLITLTDRNTVVTPQGVIEVHYYYTRDGRILRFEDPMSIPGYIEAQTDKYAPMPSQNDYRSELLPRIYMGTAQCVATFGIQDEDCLSYERFPPPLDGPATVNFWGYNATRNRKFVPHGYLNKEWCIAQDRYERKVAEYDEQAGEGCFFNEDREAFEPPPGTTGTFIKCAGGLQRTRPYNFLYEAFASEVRTFGYLERIYRLNIVGNLEESQKVRSAVLTHKHFDLVTTDSDFFRGMDYKMPTRFNPNPNEGRCPKWDVFSHLEYHAGNAHYQRWYGENIPFYYQGKYALSHGNFAAALSFAGAVFPQFEAMTFLGRPGLNYEALVDQYYDDGIKKNNYYSDRLPDPIGRCAPEFIPPAFYTPWNAACAAGTTFLNSESHVSPLQINGVRNHTALGGQGPAEEAGVREEMDPSLATLDPFHAPLLPSPVFSPDLGIPDEFNTNAGNWLYQNPNLARYFWYNLNDKFAVRGGRYGYTCPLSQVDDARRITRLTKSITGDEYNVSEFGGRLGRYGFSEANEVKVPRGRMSGLSGILMRPDGWCTLNLGTYKDNTDTCTSYDWEPDPDPWAQLGAAKAHNERQRTRGEVATMFSDASGRFYWNYLDGEQVFQSGHDMGERTPYDPSGGGGGNSRGGPMYGYVQSQECSRRKPEPVPARKEWDDPAKNWCGFKTAASSIFPDYDTPVGYSTDPIINPPSLDLAQLNVNSYNLPGAGLAWAEYWCQAKGLSNTLPNQEFYAEDRSIAQNRQNSGELLYDFDLPTRERKGRTSFEPEGSLGARSWEASPTHKYQFMSTEARIDWEGYAR